MNRKFKCTDIIWDTDGEDVKLPESLVVTVDVEDGDDLDEILGDALSDETGWCVESFSSEEVDGGSKHAGVDAQMRNVRIAKELVRLAKSLVADDFDPKTYESYGKENALDFEKKSIKRHAEQMSEDGSIQTREGKANYKAGDWIVTDEQGGKYPVHDEDFRRLYKVSGDTTEGEFETKPKQVKMFRTDKVLHIKTEWGDYTADKGDWVVLNKDGSLGCPVKPDAVESAYCKI